MEERLRKLKVGPEEFRISGEELYLYYPKGVGRSKLTNALLEGHLGVAGTARNWSTITKVIEVAKRVEAPPAKP